MSNHPESSDHLDGVQCFVLQDTWNEEDDVELREYLESLPQEVKYLTEREILKLEPSPTTMLFCDSHLVQALLVLLLPNNTDNDASVVVPSYPAELSQFYGRTIVEQRLGDHVVQEASARELPYFTKLAGSNKTALARVIRTREDESKLRSELPLDAPMYVSDVVDFVSEWRLFLSSYNSSSNNNNNNTKDDNKDDDNSKLWGCQEYSEYMIGHRLCNNNHDEPLQLVIEDVPQGVPRDSAMPSERLPNHLALWW